MAENMFAPCTSTEELFASVAQMSRASSPLLSHDWGERKARIVRDAEAVLAELRPSPGDWLELEEAVKEIVDRSPADRPAEEAEEILAVVREYVKNTVERHRQQARDTLDLARRANTLAADLAETLDMVVGNVAVPGVAEAFKDSAHHQPRDPRSLPGMDPYPAHGRPTTGFNSGGM